MAKQWAIAIGINTYHSFQSLHYAQQDAEAFCRHLINSGITAPENCLLLTPSSALHEGRSTFPLQENIAQWLKGLVTAGMGAEDSLLVFFSGYGVHGNGEDYLMAVDSDPAQPKETGIALKSIYRLLAQVPSERVLVLLDMNRNAGSQPEPAGTHTMQIASQLNRQLPQLATVLSCQPPHEFSRESLGLRHGFFTAALLEVLYAQQRQQPGASLSLATFSEKLRLRMSELCANYWRPVQTPVAIGEYDIPLGEAAATTTSLSTGQVNTGLGAEGDQDRAASVDGVVDSDASSGAVLLVPAPTASNGADTDNGPGNLNGNSNLNGNRDADATEIDPYAAAWEEEESQTVPEASTAVVQPVAVGGRPGHGGDGTDWHWADLSVAAGTGDAPGGETGEVAQDPTLLFPEPMSGTPHLLDGEGKQPGEQADLQVGSYPAEGNSGASLIVAPQPTSQPPSGGSDASSGDTGLDSNVTESAADSLGNSDHDPNWNWSGTESAIDVEPQSSDRPDDGFREGHGMVFEGNAELNRPNRPVPGMPPDESPTIDDDPEGLPIIDLDDDDLLSGDLAGNDLEGYDSTGYGSGRPSARPAWLSLRLLGALGIVSLVALSLLGVFRGNQMRGTPAKGDRLWDGPEEDAASTETVEQRVSSAQRNDSPTGSLASGLEPANAPTSSSFVATPPQPTESSVANPPIGQGPEFADGRMVSQSAISQSGTQGSDSQDSGSQTGLNGAKLLSQAGSAVKPGQASSLNQAIAIARKVPPEDPQYDRSRQAMARWSEQVLSLAQQRADQGQYLDAIATARLVPSDLPGYEAAQRGINQWQLPAQLEHARAVIRPNQASSFNRAIGIARNIPGGTPQHPEAQQLMQQWSNSIFEIAQQRANQNKLGLAIAAAQLVPPDMPAFGAAQAAIADWQPQLNDRS